MKVEKTSTEVFTPIELKITIETKRELQLLYDLFSSRFDSLRELLNRETFFENYKRSEVEQICDAFYKTIGPIIDGY